MLTLARRLGAPAAGSSAVGMTWSPLARYGAERVYTVPAEDAQQHLSLPQAERVELARRSSPAAVLVTSGPEGARTSPPEWPSDCSGIITDAVDVTAGDGGVQARQSVFSGTWLATSRSSGALPSSPSCPMPSPQGQPQPPQWSRWRWRSPTPRAAPDHRPVTQAVLGQAYGRH
ncbi:MAG: hypothetical protein R2734_17015 [Nocardioides sp.]